jgi:hypothetical protein
MYGFQNLTEKEIKQIYGEKKRFRAQRWPQTRHYLSEEKGSHWTLLGFKDSLKIPVICQIVHKNLPISFNQLAFDLIEIENTNFNLQNLIEP